MFGKLIVCFFSFVFLFLFALSANAQTTTPSSTLKQQMQDLKTEKNAALSQLKADAKAAMQAKRDEFKTRVQTIKDEKKKVQIERIDRKLANVNKKHTARFSEVLTKLQTFLDKIRANATDVKVLADIEKAQAAIDAAKTANDAQDSKEYVAQIIDDTTLRANVGSIVSQLRLDLMAVHKLVIEARQAIQQIRTDKAMIRKDSTRSANL